MNYISHIVRISWWRIQTSDERMIFFTSNIKLKNKYIYKSSVLRSHAIAITVVLKRFCFDKSKCYDFMEKVVYESHLTRTKNTFWTNSIYYDNQREKRICAVKFRNLEFCEIDKFSKSCWKENKCKVNLLC